MDPSATITKLFRALQFRKHVKGKQNVFIIKFKREEKKRKEANFDNCS